ncbi:MAG TPA: menaquinone biosynthesis protein [Bacteroidia bacterium]|nr:menaquinone biosynthesis protein [Bacteroidia bacterium]
MIKVSCVSYLNSQPFIYGLKNNSIINEIELSLDVPSVCAEKLLSGKMDIGLIPVAVIPYLKESYIISDYCIGADGKVETVLLLSDVPKEKIKSVLLDYQSRTSVLLLKILAEKFWKISPQWNDTSSDFEKNIRGETAGLVIGDRTFELKNKFRYVYDLAEEWKKFTYLPFVFACWGSNKRITDDFISRFNSALENGLKNIPRVALQYPSGGFDALDYLTKKVSYNFDGKKREAMELFLRMSGELSVPQAVTRNT